MCRRSELRAALSSPLDAVEPYTPAAARSVERSCGAPEVAEPLACLHWERQAARSPTAALLEELAQLEAALPGVSASRPQAMLLKKALPLGVQGQPRLPATRSP